MPKDEPHSHVTKPYDRESDKKISSRKDNIGEISDREPHGDRDDRGRSIDKREISVNFNITGALVADRNTFKGVVLKYSEPPESQSKSTDVSDLFNALEGYVFKGDKEIDMLHISRQSAYLIGKDRTVADIPIDHPSISKQHAILQYRQITETSEFGDVSTMIKPFILDLESTNGVFLNKVKVYVDLNHNKIPASRYIELKPNDVINFASSTRDYVFMEEIE